MKPTYKAAFAAEMRQADNAERRGDLDAAFAHLERAHVIGQRYFFTHIRTHLRMLRIARRRRDDREIRGQLARLAAVLPGYLFGWVPKGNTGGSNVSAVKPMTPPADLAALMRGYSVWRDVAGRLFGWLAAAAAVGVAVVWWNAGEARQIASRFDGICVPLTGFTGAEDIVLDRETRTAYAVGGDRRSFRSGGPGRARIWALPFDRPEGARPIDLAPATPSEFKSFGMDLHVDADGVRRLMIANRAGASHAIEVFRVLQNGSISHERTLTHPLLRNPNDLVALGPKSALVTLDKEARAGTLEELWEGARMARTGRVLRIDDAGAKIVASGLRLANGIALSADGRRLFVVEMAGQAVAVFSRDPLTEALALERTIDVGTGGDNLTVSETGDLSLAAHPKLLTLALGHQRSESAMSPSEVLRIDGATFEVSRIYVDEGRRHSGASVALVDVAAGRMLIGSAFGPHILSCRLGS